MYKLRDSRAVRCAELSSLDGDVHSFTLRPMPNDELDQFAGLTVFHYPSCSTCRKARAWLHSHKFDAEWIHIVDSPPGVETLARALATSGEKISRFFNTSGRSYRDGNFGERRKTMDERACLEALSSDGKLIRRPLVVWDGGALVGFNAERWLETLVNEQ